MLGKSYGSWKVYITENNKILTKKIMERSHQWRKSPFKVVDTWICSDSSTLCASVLTMFSCFLLQLTDVNAENEEMHRLSSNMKKKTARIQAEMEDLKLLLEEEQSRNADLEKKQRR